MVLQGSDALPTYGLRDRSSTVELLEYVGNPTGIRTQFCCLRSSRSVALNYGTKYGAATLNRTEICALRGHCSATELARHGRPEWSRTTFLNGNGPLNPSESYWANGG
jgi:hypothetical protein